MIAFGGMLLVRKAHPSVLIYGELSASEGAVGLSAAKPDKIQ
jgi:hypothetical protein